MKNKAPDEIAREHKVGTRKFANLLWESKTNNFADWIFTISQTAFLD